MGKKLLVKESEPNAVYLYCIACMVLVICLIGSPHGPGLHYTDAYREAILALGCLGMFLWWLVQNRHSQKLVLRISVLRVFLVALFVFASLSAFWAVNITFFLSKYLLWFGVATLIFVMLSLQVNTKTLTFFARVLVVAGTYISVIGLLQALFEVDIFAQGKPPAANFLNKNAAAQCVLLMIPFSLFLLFVERQKPWVFCYPFCFSLMLAYIFHTHTRSAWLSIALEFLVLIVLLIVCRKSIKEGFAKGVFAFPPKIAAGVAGVLFLVLVNVSAAGWTPFTDELLKETQNVYTRATTHVGGRGSNRFHIWGAAIVMIKASPMVGTGMGSFYHNVSHHAAEYRAHGELRVHNDLLELGVELGGIGLLLFLGALISLFVALYAVIRHGELQHKWFYMLITMGLAGTALNMQLSFPYQMPTPLMLLGLYLSLVVKGADPFVAKRELTVPMRPWSWHVALGCSGLMLVLMLIMHFLWIGVFTQSHFMLKKARWQNPLSSQFMCHKTFVKSLHDLAVYYTRKGRYRTSNKILQSLNFCLPDIWLTSDIKGINLLGLHRFSDATKALEAVKNKAPKGAYLDFINLFVAYHNGKDTENARRIYKELVSEPEELLAVQMITYRRLAQQAIGLKETKEQILKLYYLHNKYHALDPSLEAEIKPFLPKKDGAK